MNWHHKNKHINYVPYNKHIVLLCFVLLWLYDVFSEDQCVLFSHILQDCFIGTGAIFWLPQCQWSNPERYGLNQPVPNMDHVHNSWYVRYTVEQFYIQRDCWSFTLNAHIWKFCEMIFANYIYFTPVREHQTIKTILMVWSLFSVI